MVNLEVQISWQAQRFMNLEVLTLTLAPTLLTLTPTHSPTRRLSLALTHTRTHTHTRPHSLSPTLTLTHTRAHTHALTLALSLTLCLANAWHMGGGYWAFGGFKPAKNMGWDDCVLFNTADRRDVNSIVACLSRRRIPADACIFHPLTPAQMLRRFGTVEPVMFAYVHGRSHLWSFSVARKPALVFLDCLFAGGFLGSL